jgi:cell division protease FtsH
MNTAAEKDLLPLALESDRNGTRWEGLLEVFQAYFRWQNSFSPAQAAANEFFQRPPRGLCSLHRDYPLHRHYLLQQALPACLPGWEQGLAVSFRSQEPGEVPLTHVVVPSGPGTWGAALDDARVGYVSPTGERVMARVCLDQNERGGVACFTLIGCAEQAAFLWDLLEQIDAWMDANPHLRGAKLNAKGGFLKLDRAYTWDDIILGSSTLTELECHVLKFVARLPQYQALGLPGKRGVLLVGPPGTGKTLLGKVLCCTQPTTFLWVSPGEIEGPYDLQRLFDLARELQPTILFLEDLDLYASRRGGGGDLLLGELLNQLDGFATNRGMLTLATTNDPKAIEPALADRPSRFDRLIRFEPPSPSERHKLLARFLRQFPHPTDCLAELVAATDGLTGAHLQEVIHLAAQLALDEQATGDIPTLALTAEQLGQAVRMIRQHHPGGTGFYA